MIIVYCACRKTTSAAVCKKLVHQACATQSQLWAKQWKEYVTSFCVGLFLLSDVIVWFYWVEFKATCQIPGLVSVRVAPSPLPPSPCPLPHEGSWCFLLNIPCLETVLCNEKKWFVNNKLTHNMIYPCKYCEHILIQKPFLGKMQIYIKFSLSTICLSKWIEHFCPFIAINIRNFLPRKPHVPECFPSKWCLTNDWLVSWCFNLARDPADWIRLHIRSV